MNKILFIFLLAFGVNGLALDGYDVSPDSN